VATATWRTYLSPDADRSQKGAATRCTLFGIGGELRSCRPTCAPNWPTSSPPVAEARRNDIVEQLASTGGGRFRRTSEQIYLDTARIVAGCWGPVTNPNWSAGGLWMSFYTLSAVHFGDVIDDPDAARRARSMLPPLTVDGPVLVAGAASRTTGRPSTVQPNRTRPPGLSVPVELRGCPRVDQRGPRALAIGECRGPPIILCVSERVTSFAVPPRGPHAGVGVELTRKWVREWAGGSAQRSEAEPGSFLWSGGGGQCGCGVEGDLAAGEVFQLADQVALAPRLVDSGRVEVGAEIMEARVGV
jgi:hypothetical protein